MLNLSEYRGKADRLADHLPWVALVAPGIVLNKDGSFQRTLRFRGPDLESATEAELVGICARANNALRRLGSGWALFFEAERVEALGYPQSRFPDAASWLVDEERRAAFEGKVAHFESRYHLTLLFMPSPDSQARAESALVDSHHSEGERDWRQEMARFRDETARVLDLLSGFMPEVRALEDAETLTYLHGTIATRRHPVAVPETPMYLDGFLVDVPLTGGLEPMLGDQHLRTLTILGFPNLTRPGILDALNNQDFAYRWVTRFIPLDKTAATKTLTRLRRQWFAKRKSISAILREVVTNEPVPLVDSDADNKALDADEALQALGGDHVGFGYLTTTVTVWDEDRQAAAEKLRAVERVVNGLGFTTIRESVNAVEAWLGSLPGHVYANIRQPLVHTLNLAHLMPLSSVWAGPATNEHVAKVTQTDAPPLLFAETSGSTPFRLSTHVDDVGHMLIVGPTGAGKSVLLALVALQFRRYAGAQVYVFDKGNSARAATLAMGGEHHALGADGSLAFQPLRNIGDQATRSWAAEWIAGLIAHENVTLTPEVKEAVWSALSSLATAPAQERTLTGLSVLLQSNALKSALMPYTLDGPYGRLLDADDDRLALSDVQCFETEQLMHSQGAVTTPVLTYLFHRLEDRFDGRPTLLMLDEAWVYLDNPLFAARIREWLKVLRKKNVSVIFATQSLADIAGSAIAPAIIESCPQRIFLPNDRAVEPQARAAYERFGLNERQIELVARATPKRQYYLQSRRGNRLFELGLGPIALALCGASDPASQTLIGSVLSEHGQDGFAARFLNARGLDWAAELLKQFPQPKEQSS
ncbi:MULTISPECIES: conjugal transfer protein TrbE [unclassified Mesorhizobium]|uniref:conjugal transfer protein TrbE n=1 Tax=unclassified Mesorhizobium TaxID=325217 RepID=UPI000FD7BBB1|nr:MULTISPECIES: conjugal transfer protein TrbE [unclassified Mesorhizobium]RWE22953.1 MAG: conjugal transfer protein TrbE [Mesorhizobium sp.]TGQ19088.1 conjugal transfer protein TrbE [Mesorhizobium sp. M00.F.Ca.ET.217.01.1.1]TGV89976.1 conjugal transfer protein TrbE [Mesorhizobium sp. M00.F.Ca.ET.158.01.1.1]